MVAEHQDIVGPMTPRLIERQCGGWMAATPKEATLRFAVTAETEEEALQKFMVSLEKWQAELRSDLLASRG